ncbi:type I-E CRISPR-associated endonuclease Cas1e [Rhodospirillum rubrum]|uniref:CRISPR-associated endonuclease Cas1 1 n=1 Tax=Rhodospirillum rubrum (strain ATCC 11170 / ATH 1.1.1 / DSM 467 / LMG 4362 / NCIMB 8255 / S1) TaxID=269796 RepID=CAS1A_RHORT|nr:type I-E CRISPR-associated endonuclease Cas1e [Rhodospirillum rubrum]Q2RY21.1 RecName: Full=CRISPR-associated endonuclease Cas1 1 [Rhodospirillum rubrum ATCC 11170]ABC20974.1 CRISPR-associated protein, Cas1 family [Rhodospirillum rubrum ATCC 11170]AEO46639.1 CRISPR-associated protein Cas1 [Rhodospirillum rubrum F11]MBK5952528.1 subtype I-E CRISPR-associated endonuclease Cas1 [Rhodospirillum rubrum]QXG80671.1 type I-E CRISPR-associated endonuclease Cas1e [Rhodospirillum rubrum]HCF17936.1 ty
MADPAFVPLRPIAIKDRSSIVFLQRGQLDVVDGAFVLIDQEGVRVQIPVGGLACLMLEPGTRITHAAIVLCARVGCLVIWVGERGTRLYAAGQPGGARADRLLFQARNALDETARLNVVREMYRRRFDDDPPARRSVDQLRGMEGVRVREIYRLLAKKYAVDWNARRYDHNDWDGADIPNRCLSAATACLYGLCEAAILAAGYAPAIGFLHRGKPQSFVYDVADLYKVETVVPTAFSIAAKIAAGKGDDSPPERQVRIACRDQFRKSGLLEKIIPDIEEILRAGGLEPPLDAPEAVDPVIPPEEPSGDDGHRG